MNKTLDISTEICGVKFKNPTILASGILGIGSDLLIRVAKSGAGGVISKSCGLSPRKGHNNPILVDLDVGFLNAVGLPNPGAEEEKEALKKAKSKIPHDQVLIASIFADTKDNFGRVAKIVSEAKPDFLEVNISCPNTDDDFGRNFATDEKMAAEVTEIVKRSTSIPIIVKLAPNVSDIKSIARAVEEAGAGAISAINTMPGIVIDIESGQPILTNKIGGLSGPALKPIALRCVWEIASSVKIPVIGAGGVTNGNDAIEMMMAGARAVEVGTAVYYRGIGVFGLISREIEDFMKSHNYQKLEDFRGKALN
ncbi:MAG: dihydroorotate dehydrogenase [Candidatus Woykebacteria bacterium]